MPDRQTLTLPLTGPGVLKHTWDYCHKHGIPIALDSGTLLGAHRHQGFIPWDDDLDVMLLQEDFDRLKAVLHSSPPEEDGYVWVVRPPGSSSAVIGAKVVDIHTGYYNDVFPYHTRGDKLANDFPFGPVNVPRDWVIPFKPCAFEGMTLACAANTESYLNALYNNDLRIKHKYRHLGECQAPQLLHPHPGRRRAASGQRRWHIVVIAQRLSLGVLAVM